MKYKSDILTSELFRSPEKEEIRQLIVYSYPEIRRAFTIGGPFFKDAKKLVGTFRCSVRCIERDVDIYNRQLQAIRDYPSVHLSNESFSEYVDQRLKYEAPFDLMFLDFQSIINKRLENDLDKMFKCRFDKGAIIAITVSKGHDGYKRVKDTYCFRKVCGCSYEVYRKDKEQAFSTTVVAIANRCGYRIKEFVENRRTYCNNKRGTPMMFLMFKVL